MRRPFAALLVAVFLAIGIGVGVTAGTLVTGSSNHPAPTTPGIASGPAAATPTDAAASSLPPSESPEPTFTATPIPTPVPTPVLVPAPLTGMPVSPDVASRVVIGIMIDDQAAARPQAGLSQASVVWQAPAEGGIPRYMALFQDTYPVLVGPVRSSRYYFIAWAAEWLAMYVHVGGSPQALALLQSKSGRGAAVYNADEYRWGGRYLYRSRTRNAPHNVYTDAKRLRGLVDAVGAKAPAFTPAWQFAPDAPIELRPPGGSIVVPYAWNRISYAYDRATNTYLRTVTGEGAQVDAGTKQRVAPKNVVVMLMHFAPLNDGSTKERLEAQFTGTGKAWIATNGRTITGTWRKDSLTSPTQLFGPDGMPVTLTQGQTFVQVVETGTPITIRDGTIPGPAGSPDASGSPEASGSPALPGPSASLAP